ncbi:hypothetical protein CC80DRAFT_531417 [Byssothecium circinans]|uniref:Rhodopsin domain-containing protein n=1 Tax=Byssothecium circinans TaxID=147558 RepID=A0A6A5UD18_9PLEO|nr:hypothetical protein CC80DRAFT_531417 [Byssothecium circinans]
MMTKFLMCPRGHPCAQALSQTFPTYDSRCAIKMKKQFPSWTIASVLVTASVGYKVLVPAIVFTVMAILAVVLRMYSRACISRNVQVEDYFVVVATLLFGHCLLYQLSINMIKASILIQYRRIFNRVCPIIMLATAALMFLIAAALAYGFCGILFLCNPVEKFWNLQVPGTCNDAERYFWSTSIMGGVLDFAIWILPMPMVGRLKLGRRQRWGLLAVFGLGALVCTVSILRLAVHDTIEKGNVTKSVTYTILWSTIEVNVALICASLFVIKPLLQRCCPRLLTDSRSQSASEDSQEFRRWIAVEMLRATLVFEDEITEPVTFLGPGDEESAMKVGSEKREAPKFRGVKGREALQRRREAASKQLETIHEEEKQEGTTAKEREEMTRPEKALTCNEWHRIMR